MKKIKIEKINLNDDKNYREKMGGKSDWINGEYDYDLLEEISKLLPDDSNFYIAFLDEKIVSCVPRVGINGYPAMAIIFNATDKVMFSENISIKAVLTETRCPENTYDTGIKNYGNMGGAYLIRIRVKYQHGSHVGASTY